MTTKLSPAWIIFLYPNLGQFFWVAFRIILFFSIQLFSLHLVSFWTASCSTAEHWMRRSSLVCIRVFNLAREKYEWEFVIALKRIQVIPSNRESYGKSFVDIEEKLSSHLCKRWWWRWWYLNLCLFTVFSLAFTGDCWLFVRCCCTTQRRLRLLRLFEWNISRNFILDSRP